MDFLKERIGIEVGFGHASFLGIDFVEIPGVFVFSPGYDRRWRVCRYNGQFPKTMKSAYQQNWEGSLTFEKVKRYLPHFKSAIQIPIYAIGIDV